MTAILKKLMGEAGAGLDDSTGKDNLYDVLKALAEGAGQSLTAYQATIATATIAALVADSAFKIRSLRVAVGTTGSAGATTLQVHLNGASQGELTVDNTDADGTKASLSLNVDVVAGDLLELVVSAAPTSGADLAATARLSAVTVE